MKTIVVDAGHGKHTAGKRTPDGEREWSFNTQVVEAIQSELKKYDGLKVIRTDDKTGESDVSLASRVKKANDAKADAFISVHHNANTGNWGDWTGSETYVMSPKANNPKSLELAKAVHPAVVEGMGLKDRGIKDANFQVLRDTKMPAILIEGGYMDSKEDIKTLRSKTRLKKTGILIAQALAKHFELKKKVSKPSTTVKSYKIKLGDTLEKIAHEHNTTVSHILKLNPKIENPNHIWANQLITLPNGKK